MLIKDLPKEIQEVVFKRQEEQGNPRNDSLQLSSNKNNGNFDWNITKENNDFWYEIMEGNFHVFYEKYPKKEANIFKKGDYIVTLDVNDGINCAKNNFCFKQREDGIYIKPEVDLIGSKSNGDCIMTFDKKDSLKDWRYASPEEIAEYDRLGKPYDVTTLKKQENKSLVGRYIKALKDYPDLGQFRKNEVGLIIESNTYYCTVDFPSQEDYSISYPLNTDTYELLPKDYKPIESKPMTYEHSPIPTGGNYFKAKVIKDIIRKDIGTKGSLPDIIRAGSITWFNKDYTFIKHQENCRVCPENNRYHANIPAEYFEIIEDESKTESQPEFIVGKWYKNIKSGEYGKLTSPLPVDKSLFPCTEFIDCGKYYNDGISYSKSWMENLIEVDLSEIQKYLPEGHPDKIKTIDMKEIQEECKRRFPIGCKYKSATGSGAWILFKDDTVYTIHDNSVYASKNQGCLYSDGKYAELVSLPESKSEIKLEKDKYYLLKIDSTFFIDKIKSIDCNEGTFDSYGYIDINRKNWISPDEYSIISDVRECYPATEDEIEWWNICYNKNKYIPSKSELIEEAKRRYPIGTKFYPAHLNQKEYCIITNNNFQVYYGNNINVCALTESGKQFASSSDIEYTNGNSYNRNVYYDDKWADIAEEKSVEPIVESKSDYIDVGFKIGDRVRVIGFGKEGIISGFTKDKDKGVIKVTDGSAGHYGDVLEYWYDDYGLPINYYKNGQDKYYVSVKFLKKLPDSNTPNISQEQYITDIKQYPTTINQSFLIYKSKNSLDTTVQKVSEISIELKQKSKTIKF
jgi:hypothetical protein